MFGGFLLVNLYPNFYPNFYTKQLKKNNPTPQKTIKKHKNNKKSSIK
jgi:hypothetical protein